MLAAIDGMRAAGASYVRTHLSWAEYHQPGGQAWYDWLVPTLGRAFELLPCIHYTPPSLSRNGRTSGAPHRLKDYADFVDHVLSRYGDHFRHVELWNEPNNLLDWDWRLDQDWLLFCEMVGAAAHWTEHRGWKAVLGGPSPFDPHWLRLMGERGVLATVSAVGFHGFPGTWDSETDTWRGYGDHLGEMRAILDRYNRRAQIWMTEVGYSTWRGDEAEQVERFRQALAAPADRLYWYGWQDIPRTVAVQEGLYFDPRHYHMGITDAGGRPKLLRRLLGIQRHDGAAPRPDAEARRHRPPRRTDRRDGRRRLHRHQSGGRSCSMRASRSWCSTTSAARAWSATWISCAAPSAAGCIPCSPISATPRRSTTWSGTPRRCSTWPHRSR